jgi:hypothetical protein
MVPDDRQLVIDCGTLLHDFSQLRLEQDLMAPYGSDAKRLTHLMRRLIADELQRAREAGPARRRSARGAAA